eukprot:IDg12191t1
MWFCELAVPILYSSLHSQHSTLKLLRTDAADLSAATDLLASNPKAQAYHSAVALAGIEQNAADTVADCEYTMEPIPPQLQPGWAEYLGKTGQRLSAA